MQSTKQAIFKLGEEDYGLDIMDVNIVEKVITVEPVTGFPKNLKGIIKLRDGFWVTSWVP
jgi:purine-binding chemotaxis protein CheW